MNKWGQFTNTSPLHLNRLRQDSWCWLWKVDIWEYTRTEGAPLTYVCPEGIRWGGRELPKGTLMQPDNHFVTDFGSIPPPLEALPSFSRTRFLCSYLLHDSGYKLMGLWVKYPVDNEFKLVCANKADMDMALYYWVRAEGGGCIQSHAIYRAVRVASPWVAYPQDEAKK